MNEISSERQTTMEEQNLRLGKYIGVLKKDVQQARVETAAWMANVAEKQQLELSEYTGQLQRSVAQLLDDATALLDSLATAHREMAREQRDELATQLKALRQETTTLLGELSSGRQNMAQEQQKQLDAHTAQLQNEVGQLIQELSKEHQAMTVKECQSRDEYISELAQRVKQLLGDADEFLAAVRKDHSDMAQELRDALMASHRQLATDVTGMRSKILAERARLRADQGEARQVWASYGLLMAHRRGQKARATVAAPAETAQPQASAPTASVTSPVMAPEFVQTAQVPPEPAEQAQAPAELAQEAQSEPVDDDLTAIRRIGPHMQDRLRAAGIRTYTQLARMTPDQVRAAADISPTVGVEKWIEQADRLAREQ